MTTPHDPRANVDNAAKRLHASIGFPHPGNCRACRAEQRCNACGHFPPWSERCTNGRCAKCHATVCVNRGPEIHGYGNVPAVLPQA